MSDAQRARLLEYALAAGVAVFAIGGIWGVVALLDWLSAFLQSQFSMTTADARLSALCVPVALWVFCWALSAIRKAEKEVAGE